jgi:subfamily B ATP-binding cassette protein MsbA
MRRPTRSTQTHDEDLKRKIEWAAVRRLLLLAKPYRARLAVAGILALISSGLQLAIPLVVRGSANLVQRTGNVSSLDRAALVLVGVVLLSTLITYVQYVMSAYSGNRIVMDLRIQLFAHLQRLPVAFFDRTRSGDLTAHLANDVSQLQSTLTDDVVKLAGNLILLAGGMAVAVYINWRLAVVVVLVLIAVMSFFVVTGRGLRRINRAGLDALGEAMGSVSEALANIRLVKAFARESYEDGRVESKLGDVYRLSVRASKWEGLMGAVGLGGVGLMFISCAWYGGRGVMQGTFGVGDVFGFLFGMAIITTPMAQIASLYTRLQRAVGAADRIFEILDEPEESPDVPGSRPFAVDGEGEVAYEGVSFSYVQDSEVLVGLNLMLPAGKVTAIVGQSGAGKTTLSALLYRFYEPQVGAIIIDGVNVNEIHRESLRAHIGIVPQETILFNGTIRENIRYGRLDATDAEIEQAALDANVHEFVMGFPQQYDTVVGERGITLSGGQRQRVAIARALLKNPRILILDEATSSLDTKSESLVREALDRLMEGRTTLVIAHRLSTVQNAHQIAVLDHGRITEIGTHEQLLKNNGRYTELYELVGA